MPGINQSMIPMRFPGLDYDLMKFAFELPVEHVRHPLLYLKIYEKFLPELYKVVWDRTGLPLSKGIIPNHRSKILEDINYIVKRLTAGHLDFMISRRDRNYLYRKNAKFRNDVKKILINGHTVDERIIGPKGLVKLFHNTKIGKDEFFIIERLLAIELFYKYFVFS